MHGKKSSLNNKICRPHLKTRTIFQQDYFLLRQSATIKT